MGLSEVSTPRAQRVGGTRGPAEVLADHLARLQEADIKGDLAENYDQDVVVISHRGIRRGHDGVRASAAILDEEIGAERYDLVQCITVGPVGYLRWRAVGRTGSAHHGVETFVVEGGKIVAQTTHYSVAPVSPRP